MLTTLNHQTRTLLETVGLPMLAYQFRQASAPDSVLAQVLLQGQQIRSFHPPAADAYSFRLWLDASLWNHASQD